MKWWRQFALVMMLMLAACAPQAEEVIPTLIDLEATLAVQVGETQTAAAVFVPTRTPPPTWTPTPEVIVAEDAGALATPTPENAGIGAIYYIFNNDSIVRLAADGSSEVLIYVGSALSGLVLSPDEAFLAFVGQGAGSAREVFVISLDGSYVQQVSCLGFARALWPAWSPDGARVAFAASQTIDGPIGIYDAGIIGSGQCPTGNNQRGIVQLEANRMSALVWSPADDHVYSAVDAGIFRLNPHDGELEQLTISSGYGPDFSPAPHPQNGTLFYLKTDYDSQTTVKGGTLFQTSPSILEGRINEIRGTAFFAASLRWSGDGAYLLISTPSDVLVLSNRSNTTQQIVTGSRFLPQPAISPDNSLVAFVSAGRDNPNIQQIFRVGRLGDNLTQITFHQEGTISDMNWSSR